MNTIIQINCGHSFMTSRRGRREEGGHEYLGNFANDYGQFFGRGSLFFPKYVKLSSIF